MNFAWLAVAAPVALITRTITQEELLSEPRELLRTISKHCKKQLADGTTPLSSRARWWLLCKSTYLFTCEFCTSFWVSVVLAWLVFDVRLVHEGWRGSVLGVFVVMGVANIYMAAFSLLRVGLRKERAEADRAELEVKGDEAA